MSNKHVIVKKVEGKDWENALNKSFTKNVQNAKIDGFRKGKCPRDVFEKKYGIESLYSDAIDMVLPTLYQEVLKENDLEPIIQPSIDIKNISKESVEVEFTILTTPEVKIKKYTGLKVAKEKIKVTKEEIKEEIERLQSQYAEISIKEDKIEKGDTAVIDFEGFKDGVPFEGGKGENYPLEIGSNTFIPGFEDQLIGLKSEEEKDVVVTFPEDYPSEELKGQEVTFKVLVHEVKTRIVPELDEEFFKDLAIEGVNSIEELEKYSEDLIKTRKEQAAENKLIDELLEKIAEQTEIKLPEELVHEEIHRMLDSYRQRLQMQGLSLEQYMEFTKKTMEDLEKELESEARKNITYRYMIEEVSKLENIEVTDEEAEKEAERLSELYQMSKEELVNAFGGIDMIKYDSKMRKTIEFLKENN